MNLHTPTYGHPEDTMEATPKENGPRAARTGTTTPASEKP